MAADFVHYLKRAFLNRWNLLAMGAIAAFGVISGQADVILPLAMAAEIICISGMASHPRFQAYIDESERPPNLIGETLPTAPDDRVREILSSLNSKDRSRFEDLKNLCIELRRIGKKIGGGSESIQNTLSDMQIAGVNRMLWIFLKLLHSKNALDSFFDTISESEIRSNIARARQRLDEIVIQGGDEPKNVNKRNSLLDTLAASEQRLKNYEAAVENQKFIELELDRLYSRIANLAEQGINRQDPNYLATEIDVVSDYVTEAEKNMKEMDFLPDISSYNEPPPSLLRESISEPAQPHFGRQKSKS